MQTQHSLPACACVHVCAPTACAGAGLAPAPTSRTPVWVRSPRSSPVLGPLSRLGPPTCWQLSGVRLQHRRATGDFSAALSEAEFLLPAPDMIFLSPCKVAALRFRLPRRDTRLAPDTHPLLEPQSFPPPTPRGQAYPAAGHTPPAVLRPRPRRPTGTWPVACTLSNRSSGRDTRLLPAPRCPLRHSP